MGTLVLGVSGLVLLGYATSRHAPFDLVVGVLAGSAVASLVYLVGASRRRGRTSGT